MITKAVNQRRPCLCFFGVGVSQKQGRMQRDFPVASCALPETIAGWRRSRSASPKSTYPFIPDAAVLLSPELAAYRDQFARIKGEAYALTEGLGQAAFNAPPAPGAWSVGQCLHHLYVAGAQLAPHLETALERARRKRLLGEGPFGHGFIGRLFIHVIGPNTRLKLPTPGSYRPATDLAPDVVVPEFASLQDRFMASVRHADGLDLARIKVASPAVSLLRLNVSAWFAATLAHEERHLTQARRARAAMQ